MCVGGLGGFCGRGGVRFGAEELLFLRGLGALLLDFDGSGIFRCGKRSLLSISHSHLFLSNASANQKLRDP